MGKERCNGVDGGTQRLSRYIVRRHGKYLRRTHSESDVNSTAAQLLISSRTWCKPLLKVKALTYLCSPAAAIPSIMSMSKLHRPLALWLRAGKSKARSHEAAAFFCEHRRRWTTQVPSDE
ncbi:hypothetical protein OH76DRAFT_992643 [Lentinus brumalis]|uniref:Uncharacterized protein n=1 Tax=Lentinus brumalis TaxID=2498619 RepID=A0A371DQB2_9APHY|nr:hypothetical protein OH76DRAFT_992643 [Polyporus brumalis]